MLLKKITFNQKQIKITGQIYLIKALNFMYNNMVFFIIDNQNKLNFNIKISIVIILYTNTEFIYLTNIFNFTNAFFLNMLYNVNRSWHIAVHIANYMSGGIKPL